MIEFNLGSGTSAGVSRVAEVTARTRVHGSNEHKISWVGDLASSARNGDLAIFQGLAEGF